MNETDHQLEAPTHELSGATPFPWPPRADTSALDAFVATWKEACFRPTSFFRRMPREDDYGAVILYYLVLGIAVTGIQLFWESVFGNWSLAGRLLPGAENRFGGVVQFLISPIILLCTLYLVTAVCHLALLMMRDAQHGFATTSRVFAFSYSPAIFVVFPVIGNFIAFVWMIALAIVGLREAHETDGAKAAVAVLVPVFILIGLLVLAVVAGLMMGFLSTQI